MRTLKTVQLLGVSFLLQLSSLSWAFIGGSDLTENIPGVVKIFKDENVSDCSGTIIGPKQILTASHCVSTSPSTILDASTWSLVGPHLPFKSRIKVLMNPKLKIYKNFVVNVKDVHFYQPYAVKKLRLNHTPDINELLVMGDFVVLELSEKLADIKSFPQVWVGAATKGDQIWVGGFGKRGPLFNNIDVSQFDYKGSFVQLGKNDDSINFEVLNLKNEISYIAPGDSGGGVFKLINGSYHLVGLNHASYTKVLNIFYEIDQDPVTGRVLRRSNINELKMVGFIQYFNTQNIILKDWLNEILKN